VETAERHQLLAIADAEDTYRGARALQIGAMVCFGGQFLVLLAYSYFVFHRFTLGIDYGIYTQAFAEIGRGHLDPFSTIPGYPYLDSHFELIMWPLALLYTVFRTSFALLVVQDISLVGTGVVTFLWISKLVVERALSTRIAVTVLVVALALILLDPLLYYSSALDFHFEATATLFAVATAYDMWSGRSRRALMWAGLCLLCGDIGGLYVLGVGVSAVLAPRPTRRAGLLLVVVGVAWIGVISSLGANKGSFTDGYAYLAARGTLPSGFAGAWLLLKGIVAHPTRATRMISSRIHLIGHYLVPAGVIGLITPWGFGVPAVVLLTSSLQATTLFIGEPFQQFAVVPFVLFGTVSLVTWLAARSALRPPSRHHRPVTRPAWWPWVGAIAGVAVTIDALIYAVHYLPKAPQGNAAATFIPAGEAAVLRQTLAHVASTTEIIASLPISGRFGERTDFYLYDSVTASVPIKAKTVLLVLDTAHTLQLVSTAQDLLAAQFVTHHFHAHTVAQGEDVLALEWTAPPDSSAVLLP
jgi:Predicted membrane protein (DUF2079)